MSEALDAADRLGYEIPGSFADFQIERSWSMGAYKPSSLIDWQLGRPVEVEAIWASRGGAARQLGQRWAGWRCFIACSSGSLHQRRYERELRRCAQ
jgi:2-dehydropantoate 2-reductase